MSLVYLFDADNNCLSVVEGLDAFLASEYASKNNAASFLISETRIPLEKAKKSGANVVSVEPVKSQAVKWQEIRTERFFKLQETDWTQLPDVSPQVKAKFVAYRQALRDITNQPNPFTIVWPQRPE